MRSRSVVPKLGTLLAIGLLAGPVLGAEPPLSDAAREELQQSLLPTEARSVAVEVPMARLGFDEVVERALAYNSTALLARSETRRLIAVMEQARASSLPTLTMAATYNRLDGDRVLGTGDTQRLVAGANQVSGNVTVQVPLLAPARWAQWLHADDNVKVAEISAQDARQKVAVAAARGYLLVLMQRRQVEVASRSRDLAAEHFAHAQRRAAGGVGTLLDEVRARADWQVTEGQLQNVRAVLHRAQELLGALIGHDGPIDVLGEPLLDNTPVLDEALGDALWRRTDLRLLQARAWASSRLIRHAFVDFLPTVSGSFAPFFQDPPSIVQPLLGWQARLDLSLSLFDGGLRYGLRRERKALYEQTKISLWSTQLQARAEVRAAHFSLARARETVAAAHEAQRAATLAASMARQAFRAGATSNMEALDAERRARDAETALAQAEDLVRQSHLDLLIASGRFPTKLN
jgi:outer membrane protein TolC